MFRTITGAVSLSLLATSALAGGLDRTGQDISAIFNESGTFEFSVGHVKPSITGTDDSTGTTYDVAKSYTQMSANYTTQINDDFSLTFIHDQPFGVNVLYNGTPTTDQLAGTGAELSSNALTFVGKYQLNSNFSVFGGLRLQRIGGDVTLNGTSQAQGIAIAAVAKADSIDSTTLGAALQGNATAIAALGGAATVATLGAAVTTQTTNFLTGGGYSLDVANDTAAGYLVGAAYEIPEIALRVALTYNSAIDHTFDSIETVGGFPVTPPDTTEIETPASWNLDFQTGVAENTLVFGSIRYAEWENFLISPTFFAGATGGGSISSLDNSTSYSLGVGRRFSDKLSASIAIGYEAGGSDDLVSPLAPSNGNRSLSVGAQYALNDQVTLSGGVRYTKLGDARPETGTPDTARATFTNNDALSVGIRVGYSF